MKIKNDEDKNSILYQDISENDKRVTNKIFKYFYSLYLEKKEFKIFFNAIYYIFETFQFLSYAFSSIHFNSWKLKTSTIKIISNISGIFRLSILMKFLNYKIFSFIQYLLIIFIFISCLIVNLQILFVNSSSKLHQISMSFIRGIVDLIVIFLYIPITEIILMPIRCSNGKVYGIQNSLTCGENIHLLNVTLGVIGAILLLFWCIFMINFNFYSFQKSMSTVRINSNNDIIILFMKLFLVLQYLLILNEYISLIVLLLVSIIMTFCCYNESTYNNYKLEFIILIKNSLILWTYFVLLIAKLFNNVVLSGYIFFLISGYPIVIGISFTIYKEKNVGIINLNGNIRNVNDYIKKAKINIKLINSFIDRNINMRSENENEEIRNIILLRGNIMNHCKICTRKDCPLTKFMENEGNFNIQKQCLLNYMNSFFNKGMKLFPDSAFLLMLFIQFNYNKRFNLNNTRTNIFLLRKLDCTIKEKFIMFCMEQVATNNTKNGFQFNIDDDKQNDSKIDTTEQKYLKLKYLIENCIKLYGEFWGIFSTNISSNINTNKLYSLGEKINTYLNEINNLWDNDLKNKKISNECQSIAQLYSKFLLEVLWDQKKGREVYKKINEENLNNYHLNDNKKEKEENKNNTNINSLIDNQDYLLFADSDEKGNCKIHQCSASFSHLLGFKKFDLIGKPLEVIFPNILIEAHNKYIEESIKLLHNGENIQKELSYQENDLNKNTKLIMVKSRMGYIFPLFSSLNVLDDNDYSDSFLVKSKMENKAGKNEYGYYVLTNLEFNIENISSSSINLGLTLDLLKKYVVKIDYLIRTENDQKLNIYEKYKEFEEEPKIITWIFPDIIYPKDGNQQIKEDEIEELVFKSGRKRFNLQIKTIKFNENEDIAFAFKFTELSLRKKKKKLEEDTFIPKCNKNSILFDLLNLGYIRTLLVEKKSGMRNLRSFDMNEEKELVANNNKIDSKSPKKRKKNTMVEEESSEDSERNKNNLLTKEKILELQVHNYEEIKNFISSLPIYGVDVSLERFRPTGDRYSASKITESLIKIQMNHFCQRIKEKVRDLKKKNIKNITNNNINHIESPKSSSTDNYLISSNSSPMPISSQPNPSIQGEEMNKGLASDSSSTLTNIFKASSIKYIKILISYVFILTLILLIIEFLIVYRHFNKLESKIDFLKNSYIILNNLIYTKYYVTEGVIGNAYPRYIGKLFSGGKFYDEIKEELAFYRQQLTESYDTFTSNELCKEYEDFMKSTEISIYTLKLNNQENLTILYNSAVTRISSSINNLATNTELMNIENRDSYELMYNLINEYYINWEKVNNILFNDSLKTTDLKIPLMLIILAYFIISIIIIFITLKLLARFSVDREKPINLFLTLKKVVFENLKNSAENFSNKLLNKFFGNEDNEDDSQQEYQSNIHPNDINIVKFKAANEYNPSINKAFSFMKIIIIVFIFLVINLIFFIIKYYEFRKRMNKMFSFITLIDKINISQTDFILCIDIFKSYLYNRSIPILNRGDTKNIFIESFINLTDKFQESIMYNSKADEFLSGIYFQKYNQYLLGDYAELLEKDYYEENKERLVNYIAFGIKPIELRVYEIIRYFTLKYCISEEIENDNYNDISFILKLMEFKLFELTMLIKSNIKLWYEGILNLIFNAYYNFQSKNKFTYIIIFICLIVFLILYYCIIWKTNEEKLNILLKESADLINLIPQEIKNIIIEKLNE